MTAAKPPFRLGLQGKVLTAVMSFLVIVPLLILWIVDSRMQRQVDLEAASALNFAQKQFSGLLENRSRSLVSRYRVIADQARIRVSPEAAADPGTMRGILDSLLHDATEDVEHEAYLILNRQGGLVAAVQRPMGVAPEKVAEIARAGPLSENRAVVAGIDGSAFTIVSVPIHEPDLTALRQGGGVGARVQVGALVVGIRLTDATMKEILPMSGTETYLVADGRIVASNPPGAKSGEESIATVMASGSREPVRVVVEGNHYIARAYPVESQGRNQSPGPGGLRYVILSSYEERLQGVRETMRVLIELSLAGIVISALVVSWFVRRLTQPLRELATNAEAVGRGDFTQRVERVSHDECGDLAVAFNQMTSNLQGSRAELEKTVTTLRNTQTQLIQSEKLSAVGQFVAGVAHELNNPLTAVIGFSDLLSQTAADQKIRPHLDLIAKSAHRCHKIVQSLLSFARQHPPERKLIHINETIVEVLEIMAYDFRTSNITIERRLSEGLPVILADPHQLQQVFVNILSNARQAIQATRPDGRIVVTTLAEGAMLRICFIDNGPGIHPEHLSRVFDPFFTTKPVGKGTGLGMSLSYGIINEHGGKIVVSSEYGNGAAFVIDLPVAMDGKALDQPSAIKSASRPPIPGKSVLVVDDEEWILALSQALLEQDGYVVETASSGEQAVELLKHRQFDVVVSDWKMPGMNGIQLYEHLAANNVVAASRMMFMTGDVISDTFQEFLSRKSKGCLSKPFAIGEFRSAIKNMAAAATA